jgi:hypothetical protein
VTYQHPFVAVTAFDQDAFDTDSLWEFATKLLDAGCRNTHSWGEGCERFDDTIDMVHVMDEVEKRKYTDVEYVMTSWYGRPDTSALDDALWMALMAEPPQAPNKPFAAVTAPVTAKSLIAFASPRHAEYVERRLRDMDQLITDILDRDDDQA